ncbi:enoyl-CoA delta isomerase 2-like [Neocloeon triangulifer]|uniref:enoyl-CoA delta isomerase 2-like n=1 Tax=Neocloeon triangulifer TaxID=2078957 RepID=UPI00286EDBE0|nr:enoyl-CoA delta isomerase 2-like [Neocloeon triangulifer]
MGVTSYPGVKVTLNDGLRVIQLNNPKKKNALSLDVYESVTRALQEAAADPETHVTALTGSGDFYSSGNDLSSTTDGLMSGDGDEIMTKIKQAAQTLKRFVDAFIEFPKVLVAVVNGPAFGIAVTTLALCDVVYATPTATFNCPFVKLAFTPEGCSSHTFPKIMGHSLASEVLFFNRVLSAEEGLRCGLVSRVSADLDREIWPYLRKVAKDFNHIAMNLGKGMVRQWDKEDLLRINAAEVELLQQRWTSQDFFDSLIAFFAKKSKM